MIVLAASQRGCMINATDCMYSKLPPEEEYLIYLKHVEDIYWNKFKNKVHLVGSYYANKPENNLLNPIYATKTYIKHMGLE